MVKQYPHRAVFSIVDNSTQDGNGNWTPGLISTEEHSCRAEPSSGNGFITGQGGSKINYDWILYMPLPIPPIQIGSKVEVFDENNELKVSDSVKRVNKAQLNARAWL